MIAISDDDFAILVGDAIDTMHHRFKDANNVAVVIADDPTPEQRERLRLQCHETLFGLYEGIPLTKRSSAYSGVLPDKITIFKNPITAYVQNEAQLREQINHTLWHELAHHFGLNHQQIHEKER